MSRPPQEAGAGAGRPTVKCVVWDLDDTLWRGTLLEGDAVALRPHARAVLEGLDRRGILNAVASKNDEGLASQALDRLGVADLFVCLKIGWGNKSDSVRAIASEIGVGLDALLFVDDQAFERDEVRDALGEVEAREPGDLAELLLLPRLSPLHVTDVSRARRTMVKADLARGKEEAAFVGTREEFLRTLGMRVTVRHGSEADLARSAELTLRTNQLNTTGRPYALDELRALLGSSRHRFLVVDLDDRYGPSGTVGLALIGVAGGTWLLELVIMSCRVITRGVGSVLLSAILQAARDAGVVVQAEFVDSGRNRMMYITYKFAGFTEKDRRGDVQILQHDLERIRPPPPYVALEVPDIAGGRAP